MTVSWSVRMAALAKRYGKVNQVLRTWPTHYRPAQQAAVMMASYNTLTERAAYSEQLLRDTLQAAQQTPYGRGRTLELDTWPVLEKQEIQRRYKDFCRPWTLSIPAATSGSSGFPLQLKRSLASIAAEQAFLDHILAPYGITFATARVAVLRGDAVKNPDDTSPPYGTYRDNNYLQLSLPHLNAKTLPWYVETIQTYAPDMLWVYPSALDLLTTLLKQSDLQLSVKLVFSSSEMLSTAIRTKAEQVLGTQVLDYYGQAERVCLSFSNKGDEAWFVPSYGYAELIPLAIDTPPGYRAASVVGTSYWNRKMPLVRYQTDDMILYPDTYTAQDLSAVALGFKPFCRIAGRNSEYLLTPDGGRVIGLNIIPRNVDFVEQIQFLQHAIDEIEIRVRTTNGFGAKDAAQLLAQARTRIPQNMNIQIVTDQSLQRTSQHKTLFVIRKIG